MRSLHFTSQASKSWPYSYIQIPPPSHTILHKPYAHTLTPLLPVDHDCPALTSRPAVHSNKYTSVRLLPSDSTTQHHTAPHRPTQTHTDPHTLRKFQLLPPAPPYYPFPEGKSTLGVIYGVSLWADMNAATPLRAWGRSVLSLEAVCQCGSKSGHLHGYAAMMRCTVLVMDSGLC